MKYQQHIALLPFYTFFVFLIFLSSGNVFFWDTIQLGSAHALFYYKSGFTELFLPDQFDSGHIPVFGVYLAICWKILGKSLLVSHMAMLPFVLGIVWQSYRLIRRFIAEDYIYWALLLFLTDATLLAQSVLVSPDIVLVFFFLLALNSALNNQRLFLGLAVIGLFMTSMRGMMVAFSITVIDIFINFKWKEERRVFAKLAGMSLSYWPAVFLAGIYFFLHYKSKGWIAYHPDSPWAPSFERVDFKGFIYNLGIMGWRIIDFGRVFLWVFLLISGFYFWAKLKSDKRIRNLIFFAVVVLLCLSISFTTYKYLSAHRYLMPFYMLVSLIAIYVLFNAIESKKYKKWVAALLTVGLLSGNLWIYPEGIAMGWDSTLAHWPYYELRGKMLDYMEEEGIEYSDVASSFPNVSERRFMELNGSTLRHQYIDLDTNQYVLYSNIYNNITDSEIDRLKRDFDLLKEYRKRGVFLSLFKSKEKSE